MYYTNDWRISPSNFWTSNALAIGSLITNGLASSNDVINATNHASFVRTNLDNQLIGNNQFSGSNIHSHTLISGKFSLKSTTISSIAAGTTIGVAFGKIRVAGVGGAVTNTATPTVATNAIEDGTVIVIQGTSDSLTLTLQDRLDYPGTQLDLQGAPVTLEDGDSVTLEFDKDTLIWRLVSRVDVVLISDIGDSVQAYDAQLMEWSGIGTNAYLAWTGGGTGSSNLLDNGSVLLVTNSGAESVSHLDVTGNLTNWGNLHSEGAVYVESLRTVGANGVEAMDGNIIVGFSGAFVGSGSGISNAAGFLMAGLNDATNAALKASLDATNTLSGLLMTYAENRTNNTKIARTDFANNFTASNRFAGDVTIVGDLYAPSMSVTQIWTLLTNAPLYADGDGIIRTNPILKEWSGVGTNSYLFQATNAALGAALNATNTLNGLLMGYADGKDANTTNSITAATNTLNGLLMGYADAKDANTTNSITAATNTLNGLLMGYADTKDSNTTNLVTAATNTLNGLLMGYADTKDANTTNSITAATNTLNGLLLTQITNVAKIYRTIWIDAGAMVHAASVTATNSASIGSLTNGALISDTWDFDTTVPEAVLFKLMMPDEWDLGTVKAKIYWTQNTTNANDVVKWSISGAGLTHGDATGFTEGAPQVVTNECTTELDLHVTAATPAITIGGTPALGDMTIFKLWRDPVVASDLAADARLLGVAIQYKEIISNPAAW